MGDLFQRLDSFMKDRAPPGASVDMADGAFFQKFYRVDRFYSTQGCSAWVPS